MSQQTVKIQYKPGHIPGGYSFSAKNHTIFLSEYFKHIENERILAAIQEVAIRARHHYVTEVNRRRANGEKMNPVQIKRDAADKAEEEVQAKFSDVWGEVESAYRANEAPKTSSPLPPNFTPPCWGQGRGVIIIMTDSDMQKHCTTCDGTKCIDYARQMFEELHGIRS